MKTKILHWTSVLLASTALLFSSCNKDEDETGEKVLPIFPEMQNLTIYAGVPQVELSFIPNLDWTISLPLDAETAKWFQLSDGVMPASVISGRASTDPVTIYVITHDEEEFDENPTCEVMLTMGGETKPIAKITRTNAARDFNIYLSGLALDEFQEAYDFSYEYSENPVDKYTESTEPETAPEGAQELIWFTGKTGYMQAFKVESNFEWLASTPDWLTITARPMEGEYFVTADLSQISEQEVNGAIGTVDFYDRFIDPASDPGNNAHNRYCFVLPDLTKVVRNGSGAKNAAFSFNAEGYPVDTNGTVAEEKSTSGSMYSAKGVKLYIGEKKNGWYWGFEASQHEWITITDSWNEEGSAFQQHDYTVTVTANEGAAREALLLALPESVANGLGSIGGPDAMFGDGSALLPEYEPYLIATIEQEGEGGEEGGVTIAIANTELYEGLKAEGYVLFEDLTNVDPNTDEDVADNAGEIEMGASLYRLTYNNAALSSETFLPLTITGSYSYYDSYPYNNTWLALIDSSTGMLNPGQYAIVMSGIDMEQGTTGDKGSIAFFGNTPYGPGVVARIICVRNY